MTTRATVESIAEYHKDTAHRFLEHSEAEFEKGDLMQASEKAWGAVSQYMKALGTLRGMSHHSHRELRQIAHQVEDETGLERIGELFDIAESVHANFYEAWMPTRQVRARIDRMKELLVLLERIPNPDGDVPVRRPRTFFRTKEDG